MIVGIDPGNSGGLAVLSSGGVSLFKMPTDSEGDPDDRRVVEFLRDLIVSPRDTVVFVEDVPKWCGMSQFNRKTVRGSAVATLHGNYKLCVGACLAFGTSLVKLHPIKWQNLVECRNTEKLDKGPWKNKLKARALQLYPQLKVTLATADALLIMHAGILTMDPFAARKITRK